MIRVLAGCVAALGLFGCATPITYGPIAGSKNGFGFSDLRNADGGYTVHIVAGSEPQAHEFLDRRAAELCGSAHFRKNIFRAEIGVATRQGYVSGPNGYGGSYSEDYRTPPVLEAYVYCEGEAAAAAPLEQQADAEATTAPAAAAPN